MVGYRLSLKGHRTGKIELILPDPDWIIEARRVIENGGGILH